MHNPDVKILKEKMPHSSRLWTTGEIALVIAPEKKKKDGTKFKLLFCSNAQTQFEHDNIIFGEVVEGKELLHDAFKRSREGEPIYISQISMIHDF